MSCRNRKNTYSLHITSFFLGRSEQFSGFRWSDIFLGCIRKTMVPSIYVSTWNGFVIWRQKALAINDQKLPKRGVLVSVCHGVIFCRSSNSKATGKARRSYVFSTRNFEFTTVFWFAALKTSSLTSHQLSDLYFKLDKILSWTHWNSKQNFVRNSLRQKCEWFWKKSLNWLKTTRRPVSAGTFSSHHFSWRCLSKGRGPISMELPFLRHFSQFCKFENFKNSYKIHN